ncbi:hypothetical protein B0H14DRAFT_1111775 [Mycena olivaceomarginata]|nr:hypothetical protein B0H14DRAFT_1111775 [Mycena olivaceomarginata]
MSEEIAAIGVLYAPFLGGMMVGCFLFGITVSQSIIYFRNYRDDTLFLRGLVASALIVDTFHFVMVAEGVHNWYLFCKLPQNYAGLALFHWSLGASIIATYVITSMVQALYVMRVYMLSKNLWISTFIALLSVAQLGFGLFLWEDLFAADSLSALHEPKGQIGGSVELAATTLCDITISVALWWYLHKGRTGFASTERMIDKLILYMVNLGLLTSVASLLTLILWLVLPKSFAFVSLTLIRSKLYCNAMLVTLNYRRTVRTALNSTTQSLHSRALQDFEGVELDSKAYKHSKP